MDDKLKQSQLARIVVPAITDVNYAEGMTDAFDKINDNFKKIASLPFLQGVQGDSYQLEEYPIWEEDTTENWILTEDGKVLLNSIFGRDVTKDKNGNDTSNSFDIIRDNIDEILNDISPLDFFKSGSDIVNNSLYFYVIKDDTGNVIEKQLGQYYYFVDGRLKNIGKVYSDKTKVYVDKTSSELLTAFNDYTGFYQYVYDEQQMSKYKRLEILPSIYYDQDKNDICWKFNGIKTGISAIGAKGDDGKDADLLIVRAIAEESECVGKVDAIINPVGSNNSIDKWEPWNLSEEDFKEGKALICIQISDTPQDFAYGQVVKMEDGFYAYWEPNYVFSKLIGNNRITNYFYNMGGEDETATAPFYLAIPSYSNRGLAGDAESKKKAHVIDGKNDGTGENLRIFHSDTVFDDNGNQTLNPEPDKSGSRNLDIENYNVNINKRLTVDGGAEIYNLDSYLKVDSFKVTVGGTYSQLVVEGTTGSTSKNHGALVVKGGVGIGGTVNVGGNEIVTGKITGNSGIKINKGAEIYSGTGATTDANYLKVDSDEVTVGGTIGKLIIKGTEESTNQSFGALVVKGGVGIAKNLTVGKIAQVHGKIIGNSGIIINNGAEIYSGTGATTDANYLKVDSDSVTVGGTVGKLVVEGRASINGASINGDLYVNNGKIYVDNGLTVKSGGALINGNNNENEGGGTGLTVNGGRGYSGGIGLNVKGGMGDVSGGTGLIVEGGIGNDVGGTGLTVKGGYSGGIGLIVEGGDDGSGGIGLIVKGGTSSIGAGLGLKVERGGAEIYSGTGATTDANYLKVDSDKVTIGGAVGKLVVGGTEPSIGKDTGALVVTGGVGIGGSAYIESNETVSGKIIGNGGIEIKNGGNITGRSDESEDGGIGLTVEGGNGGSSGNTNCGGTGLTVKGGTSNGITSGGIGLSVEGGTGVLSGGTGLTVKGGTGGTGATGGTGLVVEGGTGGAGLIVEGGDDGSGGDGGFGLIVEGGDGRDGGNGGTGLIVTGGSGFFGGTGLIVTGGTNNNTEGSISNAIQTYGNIVIGDISGEYLSTISSGSSGANINGVEIKDKKVTAANGFFQSSDERLKNFKDDVLVDLDKLLSIPKKYFTRKTGDTKSLNIGTSAQAVQKLYPELVSKDGNGNLSVAYDKLSIIALKAIDELYMKNQELERRLKNLENNI